MRQREADSLGWTLLALMAWASMLACLIVWVTAAPWRQALPAAGTLGAEQAITKTKATPVADSASVGTPSSASAAATQPARPTAAFVLTQGSPSDAATASDALPDAPTSHPSVETEAVGARPPPVEADVRSEPGASPAAAPGDVAQEQVDVGISKVACVAESAAPPSVAYEPWERRVDELLAHREALYSDARLSEGQRVHALDQFVQANFDGPERQRAEAALRRLP